MARLKPRLIFVNKIAFMEKIIHIFEYYAFHQLTNTTKQCDWSVAAWRFNF